jgi:hypothetical protein
MAALNFPAAPSVDDLYTANGSTWKWDGTSWNVVPATALLSLLNDVALTTLTSGDVLQYDGTDWVNATTELNDNTDVNLTSPTTGDSLHYNGTNWVNKLTDFQVSTTATSLTASSWDYVIVTAATQTITLPASPANGDLVGVSVGDFTDTVVGRNGNTISGLAEDLTIDVANMGVVLIYSSSTTDWRLS